MVVYSLEAKGYQTQDILQSIVQMEAHMAGKIYLMEARIVKNFELMQKHWKDEYLLGVILVVERCIEGIKMCWYIYLMNEFI